MLAEIVVDGVFILLNQFLLAAISVLLGVFSGCCHHLLLLLLSQVRHLLQLNSPVLLLLLLPYGLIILLDDLLEIGLFGDSGQIACLVQLKEIE